MAKLFQLASCFVSTPHQSLKKEAAASGGKTKHMMGPKLVKHTAGKTRYGTVVFHKWRGPPLETQPDPPLLSALAGAGPSLFFQPPCTKKHQKELIWVPPRFPFGTLFLKNRNLEAASNFDIIFHAFRQPPGLPFEVTFRICLLKNIILERVGSQAAVSVFFL